MRYKSRRAKYAMSVGPAPAPKTLGMKFIDLANANYVMDTTGSITLLPDVIPIGAGESQRLGSQIHLSTLWCHARVAANAATTVSEGTMLIVWDKTPNLLLPAITAIMNSASPGSFPRDSARRRFKILKRLDFQVAGNSTTPATGLEVQDADFFLPLPKGCVCEYDDTIATTGAITTIVTGGLYLLTFGSNAAGTGALTLTASFRTRFANPQ